MGLDMYLTAERYFWNDEEKPHLDCIPEGYQTKTVTVQVAYWRKANAVHRWFVDNIQDGKDECLAHFAPREKLLELCQLCQKVLDDPDQAAELLPTTNGFFFGTTDYDEWYFADLKETIRQITAALAIFPENQWDFEYRSSW